MAARPHVSLFEAVKLGSSERVDLLIVGRVDVNTTDMYGRTPLHYAADFGHDAIARALLDAGANKEAKEHIYGHTPLHLAAHYGRAAVARTLVDCGANKEATTKEGDTSFTIARARGWGAVLSVLEGRAFSQYLSATDEEAQRVGSRLIEATRASDIAQVRNILASAADVDYADMYGRSPLHYAADIGHEAAARLLLYAGANKDAVEKLYGHTPLHLAAVYGRDLVAQLLLDAAADPNARTHRSETPLDIARARGSTAVVALLEKVNPTYSGLRSAMRDPDAGRQLVEAVRTSDAARVPKLLVNANVNHSDEQGNTALHYAAGKGREAMARLLLLHGANKEAKDSEGNTPLHKAVYFGYDDRVARLLLDHGADVDATNAVGRTPLHVATDVGRERIVQMLLDAGANAKLQTPFGVTPIGLARRYGHKSILEMLESHPPAARSYAKKRQYNANKSTLRFKAAREDAGTSTAKSDASGASTPQASFQEDKSGSGSPGTTPSPTKSPMQKGGSLAAGIRSARKGLKSASRAISQIADGF